MTPTGTQME